MPKKNAGNKKNKSNFAKLRIFQSKKKGSL